MTDVCDDLKVLKVRNWKELAMDGKAWSDLFEKVKTTKGCSANGGRRQIQYLFLIHSIHINKYTLVTVIYTLLCYSITAE
jgi:hypothetical protein